MSLVYRPDHPQADEYGMVEKRIAGPRYKSASAPAVHSDTMFNHIKHMGTGEMIDSKARYRQATRFSGCVEVGTDPSIRKAKPMHEPSMREVVTDVQRALGELRSR